MRRIRRIAVIVGSALVALLIVIGLVLSLTWPRSALTSVALRFFLQQRNLHVARGTVHVGHGVLDITDLDVKDGAGNDFFLARHILVKFEAAGLLGRSDRRFGLQSIVLQRPVLRLIHLADGSWNAAALTGGGVAAPAGAAPSARVVAPYRFNVRVEAGEVQVIDPQALVHFAHAFSLGQINGTLAFNEGATSSGALRAQLRTDQGSTSVAAGFFENDVIAFARASATAHDVAIAPLVDAIVPSKFFALERGRIDLQGQAYAVGYPAGAPSWHLSADALLRDGRLRVVPLAVPARDLTGRLHFQDGLLSAALLHGTAAGVPLSAHGALQLFGGVRFALAVTQAGRLEQQRRLFAFSRALPLAGSSALAVRIDGPVEDLRVSGAARVSSGVYGPITIHGLAGSLFYNNNHLTLAAFDRPLAGGWVWSDGDIDLKPATPRINMVAQLVLPAARVPFVANLNARGTVQSLATATGPVSQLAGRGYAQLSGGDVRARAFFTADSDELLLGPLLMQTQKGALTVAVRTDRSNRAVQPHRSLEAFAEHIPLQVSSGTFALPDIPSFAITLPELRGTFDGGAFAGGDGALPAVAIAATANQLSLSGVTVQHVALRGAGANGFVNIAQIAAHGGSAEADAHGAALLDSNLRVRAAALQGTATANLAMFAHAAPAARMSGSMQGRFFAMLDGSAWTVSAQARSSDARIGGIPIQAADATVGGKPAGDSSVLANMDAAGGQVSAVGSIANAQGAAPDSGTRVAALANHVDLTTLKNFGVPLQRGSAVAIASIGGSLRRPDVRGAAAMTGSFRNTPVSGDVDVGYKDGILHSNASNVIVDNNLARLSGSVAGLANASPAKAALDLRVQVHEADLSAISQYAGSSSGLTGATNADVRIAGSAAQPRISGFVLTDTGTLRGVPFDDLSGNIAASSGHVQLANGQVQLGTSRFHVSGQISPGVVALHATSPHVDMSDFNDFFGGADMFAGTGAFRVNFASSNAGLSAAGGLRLDDAALHDYELGHIETHFSSDQGALLATIAQNGPGGSAALSGRVAFRAYVHGLPDFASATYNVKANVRNLDVAEITPIVHAEDVGLSGVVDAAGTLEGTLRRPVAFARVSLHDGHLRRITINNLSGLVQSDPSGVRLTRVQVATKFVTGDGQGRYEFGTRRVSAALNLDASDLAELTSVFQLPVAMRGPAHATIGLSGTTAKPLLQATLAGSHNTVAGFVFNDFKARFQYVPGELDIGDTQLGLASGGQLNVTGALPIQLQPLALGPKQRAVNLSLTASAVNLAEFNTLTGSNATLSGILNAQASVTGNAGNPSVAGVASVRAGGVVSRWETVPFTNVSADVSLLKDTITLRGLRGQLGGGTLGINGAAHIVPAVGLRSNAGLQFYTNLNLRNANLDVPGWLSGTVNGDLSLTRTAVRPYLSGSIALNSATIPFSAIIALASGSATALASQTTQKNIPGVPTPAPGHSVAYAGSIFGNAPGLLTNLIPATPAPKKFSVPPIDLNVAVSAGKDVRVRGGSAIDLTADGAVVLGGSVESPSLAGSFRAVRGQIGYFDTTFRLERGTVTFSPTEGLLPTLDATAVTNAGGTDITLTLSGRIDNLNTELSSNPPMSRDQIVALLLHAPQVASLTSGSQQAAQTALFQTAQSYFSAELTRNLLFPFESALAESLNLEQIALIFDPQGNLAVEVRTRFSSNVSALYRSSLTVPVTQSYGVSYRLRDYLALELLQAQPPSGQTSTLITLRYLFN